ncbi:GFA family protein [Roseibium sp. CAU 1637]|uniref:GFA family protein n=2 Tax=Stappiaceae TaxID=2821832 RepID=A0A939J5R9_9HYPH|nr:GFA family protein [Roseibium limicola]
MCQKALGSPYATLVTSRDLTYTRGKPTYFQSSDKVRRGFCGACGTPLTFEFDGFDPDITVTSLDDPSAMPPVVQLAVESRLPWCEDVSQLPQENSGLEAGAIHSHQHPDHDTAEWPPQED